jgi:RNA polymerase sigma factor (TIGR02999 family)
MSAPQTDVTTLLGLAAQGDRHAQDKLFRELEKELRSRARARLRRERSPHDLQTTALVDEAFVKLVGDREMTWEDRSQFYCCAARVMRRILVDDARQRNAQKRDDGKRPAALHRVPDPVDRSSPDPLTLLALNEALTKLAKLYPELMQIVELHHFGGWDLKEIADDILHVPYITVKRKWAKAIALLHREMSGGDDDV